MNYECKLKLQNFKSCSCGETSVMLAPSVGWIHFCACLFYSVSDYSFCHFIILFSCSFHLFSSYLFIPHSFCWPVHPLVLRLSIFFFFFVSIRFFSLFVRCIEVFNCLFRSLASYLFTDLSFRSGICLFHLFSGY